MPAPVRYPNNCPPPPLSAGVGRRLQPPALDSYSDTNGTHETFNVTDIFGAPRAIRVLLPTGYRDQPERKYELLVMQDGQNLFRDEDAAFGRSWRLGATIFDGRQSGRLRDFITVGIDNARDFKKRAFEFTPWRDKRGNAGGGADQYLNWMESVVMPELEKRYRLAPGADNHYIGGSSLGALASITALALKPQVFAGGVILMSGSWHWQNDSFIEWAKSQHFASDARVWLDMGDQEMFGDKDGNPQPMLPKAEKVYRALLSTGAFTDETLRFYVESGVPGQEQHNEPTWGERVRHPLEFIFPH